jgi:hypothetical protein
MPLCRSRSSGPVVPLLAPRPRASAVPSPPPDMSQVMRICSPVQHHLYGADRRSSAQRKRRSTADGVTLAIWWRNLFGWEMVDYAASLGIRSTDAHAGPPAKAGRYRPRPGGSSSLRSLRTWQGCLQSVTNQKSGSGGESTNQLNDSCAFGQDTATNDGAANPSIGE